MDVPADVVDVEAVSAVAQARLHCPVEGCPRRFTTKRGLTRHLSAHKIGEPSANFSGVPGYSPPATIELPDGRLKCAECEHIEATQKSMISHKRTHFSTARENYIKNLEVAARETSTLRRALREANARLEQEQAGEAPAATPVAASADPAETEDPLTVDGALDFIRDQLYSAEEEIATLRAQLKEVDPSVDISAPRPWKDSPDALAMVELIRDAFLQFCVGDLTMTRFVTEVEEALRLMYPDITDE